MLTYDTIKQMCKDKGVTITGLEKELGFAKGSLCKINTNKPSMEKVRKLAEYFNVSTDYLTTEDNKEKEEYYINKETAEIAQNIFESKELRLLYDAARDAQPEDIQTAYDMLLALKRKEKGNID